MTYYEEFGIPPSAAPDEIRHAHRRLMKILHPDLQNEEGTRILAEIQSRRINGMAQTLLDPAQREEYDLGLLDITPHHHEVKWAYSLFAFGAAFLLCCGVGIWILLTDHPPTNVAVASGAAATQQHGGESEPPLNRREASSRRRLEASKTSISSTKEERDSEPKVIAVDQPVREIQALRVEPPHIEASQPPARAPEVIAPKAAAPPAGTQENPLVGTWIYVPAPTAEEDRKMYRPEYIEMRIRNIRGVLEGQYRARYHVPDRPLSPNVGFHFAGQPGPATAAFRWSGSNGLAGQVELKLMTTNSVQVDWRVTELAEMADLVSGTAILTRVQ